MMVEFLCVTEKTETETERIVVNNPDKYTLLLLCITFKPRVQWYNSL